jgi:hypothetical protein
MSHYPEGSERWQGSAIETAERACIIIPPTAVCWLSCYTPPDLRWKQSTVKAPGGVYGALLDVCPTLGYNKPCPGLVQTGYLIESKENKDV